MWRHRCVCRWRTRTAGGAPAASRRTTGKGDKIGPVGERVLELRLTTQHGGGALSSGQRNLAASEQVLRDYRAGAHVWRGQEEEQKNENQ
jgi:hypothetical protein